MSTWDDDLELPTFLKVGTPENEALRARPAPPPRQHAPVDALSPKKPADASTAAFLAEMESQRRTKTQNRIAKMLIRKEDHTGQRWDARRCRWVPIEGAKKMISIAVPQRVYGSSHDAARAARSLLGPDAEVTIKPVKGGFTFLTISAVKATIEPAQPAKEETAAMKMPTKMAEGQTGLSRQFVIDPNKVYSVKSNAARDAKRAGLDHKKVVVSTADHKGFKIVADNDRPAEPETKKPAKAASVAVGASGEPGAVGAKSPKKAPAKAASKPAKAAKPAKAPKAAKPAPKPRAAKDGASKSKREIVADLLLRPEGTTRAEILAATGWPAVTVQGQATASGIVLRQEKKPGEPTRYYGSMPEPA